VNDAILAALITTGGAALAAALSAWGAVRKSRVETDKKLDLLLYRQDQTDAKLVNIGNILDRLARLETKVDGLEGKR
jgi:flagellar motility protein MotE (MotC chaperone)